MKLPEINPNAPEDVKEVLIGLHALIQFNLSPGQPLKDEELQIVVDAARVIREHGELLAARKPPEGIRIVSDGTALGTKVFMPNGEEMPTGAVRSIAWRVGKNSLSTATIEFAVAQIDAVGVPDPGTHDSNSRRVTGEDVLDARDSGDPLCGKCYHPESEHGRGGMDGPPGCNHDGGSGVTCKCIGFVSRHSK